MTNVAKLIKFLEQFPEDTIVHVIDGWKNGRFDGNAESVELQLQRIRGDTGAEHWDYDKNQKVLVLGISS